MKFRILLSTLCILALWQNVFAAETEPNDTRAQANTLALNGANTGAINTATDVDWWKVTATSDGKLSVSITVSNGKNLWCQVYDNDGTTLLNQAYTASATSVVTDGLAAGTYYLKLFPYYPGELPAYTVSNTLTVPTEANDTEPNGSKATALTLALNSSVTGHTNYYYNKVKDSADWYKITTNADGRIRLRIKSGNGQNVWAYLFDNNGTTQLAASYTTGDAIVVNKDGLAAGTYYIRVNTYYSNEFAPYTLYDSLFVPAEANDMEPDSTRALALTLPLNSSKQGHINYYYNNHADSVDWYKVTTNKDGRLRLRIKSGNGQNVWAYLFDNNGTTQIAAGYTSGDAFVVNKDGLAAGTYYIRVNTYYTNEWAPYTIYDSLFAPTQANDTEPNGNKAAALTLPLNSSVTGHINYYYKNVQDTTDWYKITTTQDGMINIGIQSHNGQNVWAYLLDNNGTTVIASAYASGSTSYSFDGLKAGTYYVRINTYYTNEFAPYTLSNSVTYYSFADDAEPNNYFKLAKTMPSNDSITGHVNFYYNGSTDSADCHKLYYSGSGNLTLSFLQQNRIKYGSTAPTWFRVYKDTAAAALYSNYTNDARLTVNLTGLAQGYYYVKVFTYYNGAGDHFSSYRITNTYTQVNKAAIKITAIDSTPACDSTNSITYKLSKSQAPYRVQLFRFGLPYGAVRVVAGTTTAFTGLPSGIYYATVFGDGATGTAFSKSAATVFMPVPQNTTTTAIQARQARLNWSAVSCAGFYSIQYHVAGTAAWKTVNTTGNVTSFVLKNLTPSTTYRWRVASVDTLNKITATSSFSDSVTFTTPATIAMAANDADNMSIAPKPGAAAFTVSPNPASNFFTIRYNGSAQDKLVATLYSANGKALWASGTLSAQALNGKQVMVNQFENGLYFLRITDGQGAVKDVIKVAVMR